MNITSFLIYCVIVTFTPGPSNIVILSAAHHYGIKNAIRYIAGASIAFALLLTASVVLNRALTASVPTILTAIRITGSIFMLYLAYQVFRMDITNSTSK